MNIFYKRPLLLALFIFAFVSVLCSTLNSFFRNIILQICFAILIIVFIITLVLLIIKYKHVRIFTTFTLCLLFAFIASFSSHSFFDNNLYFIERLGEERNVVATVKECTYSATYITSYTADIQSINGVKTSFTAEISSAPPIYLEIGESIRADMTFEPFSVTEYDFDARMSNISNGVLIGATFQNAEIIAPAESFDIVSMFNRLRDRIEHTVDKKFDKSAPLIKALLIGKTNDIDARTKFNFSRLGISHILSISGTHFSVLLGMLALLLSTLGINKRIVYAILIPIALFYVGLSGFSFSVCRAGIMALLSYWSFLCGRQRDAYTALFIALAVILIVSPYAVMSISLWLSFTATFTILIILDLLSNVLLTRDIPWYKKILNYVILHILITVAVCFATLPIVALYFGYISKISPIANLIIVPFFEVFLYIIPFSVLFSSIPLVVSVTEKLGSSLLLIVEEIASIDNLLFAVNQRFVIIIATIGIAVTLVLIAIPLRKRIFIILPSIICLFAITVGLILFYKDKKDETHVTYFNSGISDALVITDTNKTACIDITAGTTAAMYYTQAVIKAHYSAKISAYIFTHYRKAHINAFEKLASRVEIEKAYFPIPKEGASAEYMDDVINMAKDLGISIVLFDYGEPFEFEGCEITILEPQLLSRSSHEIISIYVSTPEDDMLYLGSSFSEGKLDYSKYIFDAEYIIFGQHYPKAKNRFCFETNAILIYGNKDIFDLSEIKSNVHILNNGCKYNFWLK